MVSILTADLGNSALKLLVWQWGGSLAPARPILRRAVREGEDLESALAGLGGLAAAAFSTVAGEERSRAVLSALRKALDGGGPLILEPGVENRCLHPETTGLDRLFAARGAFEWGLSCALVVDAGSALTVDAYRREGPRPVFLGGAIAPGPELLAQALASGTARLPRVDPRPAVPALGRDTEGALLAGIAVGFRGAAHELVEAIAREAGFGGAPVLLAGGAAGYLDDPTAFPGRELRRDPDLVHRGLLGAALAELRR